MPVLQCLSRERLKRDTVEGRIVHLAKKDTEAAAPVADGGVAVKKNTPATNVKKPKLPAKNKSRLPRKKKKQQKKAAERL